MRYHRVRQGESAGTVARRYGVKLDDLWAHPDNADLKRQRKSPHVLAPGDTLAIPETEPKTVDAPTGRMHRFQVKVARVPLEIRFLREGEAKAGHKYVLTVGDTRIDGQLDGDGWLRAEVPAGTTEVTVEIEDKELVDQIAEANGGEPVSEELLRAARRRHVLRIHHLDPVDTESGAAQRLAHLGWACAPPGSPTGDAEEDGERAARFEAAIDAFQRKHGIDPTGELDGATRAKFEEIHGT